MEAAPLRRIAERLTVERLDFEGHVIMRIVGFVHQSHGLSGPAVSQRGLVMRNARDPLIKQSIIHPDSPKRRGLNFRKVLNKSRTMCCNTLL